METDRILINEGWRFALTGDVNAGEGIFSDVVLPHDWQIHNTPAPDAKGGGSQGFYPREQVGVYRFKLFADESWANKEVRILFDGIQRFSEVYLNGKPVGGRKYGYIPVLCELDGLNYGEENLITVRVDNAACSDLGIAGGDRWYSGAGIYRNVWLLIDDRTHIRHDGIYVKAEPVFKGPSGDVPDVLGIRCASASVHVTAEIDGCTDGCSVTAEITGFGTELSCTGNAAARCEFDFDIPSPRLWSTGDPALYRLKITLTRAGEVTDTQLVSFGVRSAVFDDEDGFILNGVKTKLWGVNFHHDCAPFGAAVPREVWVRRFENCKKLGINAVRASHNPMAEEFYDLCDEMGLMVIDEYCDKWQQSNLYFDRIDDAERLEEIEIMLRRNRNHPSIILWSVGNEIPTQYSEYFYQTLSLLCAKVRGLDTTRPVSAALIGFVTRDFNDTTPLGKKLAAVRRYAEIVDVFMGNYMEQLYEKLRESGMRKPIIGSEVRTLYRHSEISMNTTDVSGESPYAIVKRYPWVCGAFVWAGCDYLGESSGWPCRGWTGNLLDSTAHFKLRAWYCASQFRSDPVLKLAVYDESEPWDMARGLWGFPQMRAHWKYQQFEKVMHVAAMTNCDTVKVYQNNQSVRTGYLKDSPDGMIHFHIPYIPGVLVAEGYQNGRLVAKDTLYSDYSPEAVEIKLSRQELPADGTSVVLADVFLNDSHGNPYVLGDMQAEISLEGCGEIAAVDNGNALCLETGPENRFFNGHMLVYIRAPRQAGTAKLIISVPQAGTAQAEIAFR